MGWAALSSSAAFGGYQWTNQQPPRQQPQQQPQQQQPPQQQPPQQQPPQQPYQPPSQGDYGNSRRPQPQRPPHPTRQQPQQPLPRPARPPLSGGFSYKDGVQPHVLDATDASVRRIGEAFLAATGVKLVVTESDRTALLMARALYGRFAAGGSEDGYANPALPRAAREVYLRHVVASAPGDPPPTQAARQAAYVAAVRDMATVIQAQIDRGETMSDHMRGHAVDFRWAVLTPEQIALLQQLVRNEGGELKPERQPPHYHAEFGRPR